MVDEVTARSGLGTESILEPREHIQPSVVSQMVGYYIRAGAMPAPASADRLQYEVT